MRTLLAVPFAGPLGERLLREILSYGFKGVRCDVSEHQKTAWSQARSLAEAPECFPVLLLFGGHMKRHDGEPWKPKGMLDHVNDECEKLRECGFLDREIAIEIGNEPDIAHDYWKDRPEELARVYVDAIEIVSSYSTKWRTLSPSISNLNERGLKYLRRMNLRSADCVAFHRYPNGRDFDDTHGGFETRREEVERLRDLSYGAPLWCTELGWPEYTHDYLLSESDVADRIEREIRFWDEQEIEALCLYQINSASTQFDPHASHDARRLASYGFRRPNGEWKPVAERVRSLREEMHR